jgi:hypothetical protein
MVTFEAMPIDDIEMADAPAPEAFEAYGARDTWETLRGRAKWAIERAAALPKAAAPRMLGRSVVVAGASALALVGLVYSWTSQSEAASIRPTPQRWSWTPAMARVDPARPALWAIVERDGGALAAAPPVLGAQARALVTPAARTRRSLPVPAVAAEPYPEAAAVPVTEPPAVRSEPVAPPPPPEPAEETSGTPADRAAVEQAIAAFEQAHDRLDQGAISALVPSLDAPGLSAALDGVSARDVSFRDCDVEWTAARAIATCSGEVRYVRAEGAEIRVAVWTFTLTRSNARWRIEHVRIR